MTNALHQKYLKMVRPFYPKPVYPTRKNEWNMGHKCMEYINRKIPYNSVLSTSWIGTFLQKTHITGVVPDNVDIKKFFEIWSFAGDQLHFMRGKKAQTELLVKNYGIANCGEWATIASNWFTNQKIPHQRISMKISKHENVNQDKHAFLLFHQKKPELCADFETAINHLNDPDMYVLDLWFQRCEPAVKMMDYYCRELIDNSDIKNPKNFENGYGVYFQEDSFGYFHKLQKNKTTADMFEAYYMIGCVAQKSNTTSFQFNAAPIILKNNQSLTELKMRQLFNQNTAR